MYRRDEEASPPPNHGTYARSDEDDDNNNDEDDEHPKRQRLLRTYLVRARQLFLWAIMASTVLMGILASSLAFGPSNFILWGVVDLSRLRRRSPRHCDRGYWRGPDISMSPVVRYDCSFQLCHHVHRGGEGHLFLGSCENVTTTEKEKNGKQDEGSVAATAMPVLIKTLVGNHALEGARQEADATVWMGQKTKVHVLHRGINFIIFRQLEGYAHAIAVHRRQTTEERRTAFVQQFLHQSLDQLRWLHKKHLHLDLHHRNILSKWEEGTSWDFQLIDFSDSRPIRHARFAVREAFTGKEHLAKHPLAVCLLKRVSHSAREYCKRHADIRICPGLLDFFMIAVLALDLLHRDAKVEFHMASGFDFKDVVEKLEYLKGILKQVEENSTPESPLARTTNLIAQILDEDRFNSTLVCG